MRNQAPPQTVQGSLAGFGILLDHPLLLSGGTVEARRQMQRLDQGDDAGPELVRRGFLSDATAHAM